MGTAGTDGIAGGRLAVGCGGGNAGRSWRIVSAGICGRAGGAGIAAGPWASRSASSASWRGSSSTVASTLGRWP
jgi:hypothetical protein